jgi:hypothetical protein
VSSAAGALVFREGCAHADRDKPAEKVAASSKQAAGLDTTLSG